MTQNSNKKYITILILLLFCILCLGYINIKVHADSGFDSSYDSGGSSWGSGGSSWDSHSSSYDYDRSSNQNYNYNHNYSYGGNNSNKNSNNSSLVALIPSLIFFGTIIIIYLYVKSPKTNVINNKVNNYVNNKELIIPIPGFNKEQFIKDIYQNFVDVQISWMNFDYDKLKKLLTDELFNSYKSQLKTLSLKKQKNVMSDFELVSCDIVEFNESNNEYSIQVLLKVKFYDYIVDNNNIVLRGKNNRRLFNSYYLTFIRSKDNKQNKCPNCNAPLDNTNICPYCKSTIVIDYHNFVLSKKQLVIQREE